MRRSSSWPRSGRVRVEASMPREGTEPGCSGSDRHAGPRMPARRGRGRRPRIRNMPSGSTAPLRQAIERSFPDRPFSLELWDGARVPSTAPGGPAVRVRSPRTLGHLLRAPGLLGVIRAHVSGWLDADDLDAVLALASGSWRAPRLGLRGPAVLLPAAVRAAGPAAPRP